MRGVARRPESGPAMRIEGRGGVTTAVELLFRTDQALKAAGQSALAAHERVRGSGLWPSGGAYHR